MISHFFAAPARRWAKQLPDPPLYTPLGSEHRALDDIVRVVDEWEVEGKER